MKEEIKISRLNQFIEDFNLFIKTMLSYHCLKCRKNTDTENPKVVGTKDWKNYAIIKMCVMCDSKKSKFIKEQETSGLLSSFGIKTPLSKIPLVGC